MTAASVLLAFLRGTMTSATRNRRFPVAFNDPSEYTGKDEYLPALQLDQLPSGSPVAFDVRHQLGELADPLGRPIDPAFNISKFWIPCEWKRFGLGTLEIVKVAFAGEPMPLAGYDFSFYDFGCIVCSNLGK
ncbi:MAG: hypothetical protein IPL29_02465 [Propionivibrio sp.]|nr:hypothetical protein [Propionivibrio sp.]